MIKPALAVINDFFCVSVAAVAVLNVMGAPVFYL